MDRIQNEEQLRLIWDHVTKLATDIAVKHRILPGEFWSRGKDKRLAQARKELGFALRDTLGYRTSLNADNTKTIHTFLIFDNPRAMESLGFKPVSYPMIGKLLGMNHSTFVLHAAQRRDVERDRIYANTPPPPNDLPSEVYQRDAMGRKP